VHGSRRARECIDLGVVFQWRHLRRLSDFPEPGGVRMCMTPAEHQVRRVALRAALLAALQRVLLLPPCSASCSCRLAARLAALLSVFLPCCMSSSPPFSAPPPPFPPFPPFWRRGTAEGLRALVAWWYEGTSMVV